MHRFSLRAIFIATAAVAVVSAIAVAFRPRDLRNEIEKIAKVSKSFEREDLIGEYSLPSERLRISLDGTYCLNLYAECSQGCDFVERGTWCLDRNILCFQVSPSPSNSGNPMKWAFATVQDGDVSLIPNFYAHSYLDRGYRKSLSFRPSKGDLSSDEK